MTTGFCFTGALSVVKFLTQAGWPELTIQAGGYALSCFFVAAYLLATRISAPPEGEKRWTMSAGFFITMSMVTLILSIKLGAPIGDLSALVSINVVMSALLGRLLLGDPLRWVHAVSALCSLSGALLISRPTMLFGRPEEAPETSDTAWLGYVLGPVAGLFDACAIISARKCPSTSEWQVAVSYYAQASVLLILLIQVPGLEPHPVEKIQASPAEAAMWVGILTAWDLPSMVIYAMAAKALPAALSATVDTASRMVLGYVADVLLFGGRLQGLTCVGGILMLFAVAMTAMVRQQPQSASDHQVEMESTSTTDQQGSHDTDLDDIASVASFAASEFVDVEPSARRNLGKIARQLRLRFQQSNISKAASIGATTLGATSCNNA